MTLEFWPRSAAFRPPEPAQENPEEAETPQARDAHRRRKTPTNVMRPSALINARAASRSQIPPIRSTAKNPGW